jgi:hypothetical protein
VADCPHCGRPVAMVRAKCFYCGKPLPQQLLAEAQASAVDAIQKLEQLPGIPRAEAAQASALPDRLLIILDLRQGEPATVAQALLVSTFEARQRLRRGGYQLLRVAQADDARAEAARIAAAGLRALTLAEQQARVEPRLVSGGRLEPGRLVGRSPEGRFEWAAADLLLVVKGPIRREHQAGDKQLKRLKSAAPSEGYRFHLHRVGDARPLELDPDAFDFDAERGKVGSSLLRISAWLDGFEKPPRVDDGFRLLPPALQASQASDPTALALGRSSQRKATNVVLDNLLQFRFYSGWRGALERAG